MGIKNFTKFLRDKYPSVFKPIHISNYTRKKVGIESHLFLYKFKCSTFSQNPNYAHHYNNTSSNANSWKIQLMRFLLSLRKHNVHPVVILEGSNKPSAKNATVLSRIEGREKVKKRVQLLTDMKNMLKNGEFINDAFQKQLTDLGQNMSIFPDLQTQILKFPKKISSRSSKSDKSSHSSKSDTSTISNRELLLHTHPAIKFIDEEIQKLLKRCVTVTNDDIEVLKKICDGIGISYIQAPCEAEAYLCRLLHDKKIDAVMTEDTDVLAYGCFRWLTKYSTKSDEDGNSNMCYECDFLDICCEMDITREEFLELCIMCGCDYTDNPKGLGPVKLLEKIKSGKYKHLWNDEYEDAKEIFLNQGVEETYPKVEWCVIPSVKRIKNMLNFIGSRDDPQKIQDTLRTKVHFEG